MKLATWIKYHRAEIDMHVKSKCSNCSIRNDEERRLWVVNDESLYLWAKADGVDFEE